MTRINWKAISWAKEQEIKEQPVQIKSELLIKLLTILEKEQPERFQDLAKQMFKIMEESTWK